MRPKKVDIIDNLHGTMVRDPYRWMENAENKELKEWIAQENARTQAYLTTSSKEQFSAELKKLYQVSRYQLPEREGERLFFLKSEGLQNQPVLYVQREGESPEVLVDPNTLSEDCTVALTHFSPSPDGKLVAYALAEQGSDWKEIRIRQVESKQDLPEVISRVKFTPISWLGNKAFIYTRFPDAGSVDSADENNYNKVYLHKIDTLQADDELIFERPDYKELGFFPQVSDDNKHLLIHASEGTSSHNLVYYCSTDNLLDVTAIVPKADASYDFIGNIGNTLYFRTTKNAPKGRIVYLDISQDPKELVEVIPEQSRVLIFGKMVAKRFVGCYMQDAYHQLLVYSLDGKLYEEISLPSYGSIWGITVKQEDKDLLFLFNSFLQPPTIYSYNLSTAELVTVVEVDSTFDPNDYQVSQEFFTSKDGTKVPMFIVHKRGLTRNGQNKALLYGYGGFNISLSPQFNPLVISWIENGGVYCQANLRGGAEFGEEWHQAGMLKNKQNVFDDFIAASHFLVDEKYTSSKNLAIMGRSNGGLLTAVCLTQQPKLFGAVICGVPVTDMLRYHKFTVGRYWIPEFGDPENPEHFPFLYAYSPLHNVTEGQEYPAVLITTAETDDRVVPAHALKFAATLQDAQAGEEPILLRVETKAGHGLGKPTDKVIEETADMLAFVDKALE